MGYIYKITNLINDTIYIGQTNRSIHARWVDHVNASLNNGKDSKEPLHKAIKKYGKENFKVEEIEQCEQNKLNEREMYWINFYDSYYNGYNASLGGSGHTKYNYDEIVNYLLQNDNSILKTCQHFNIYDQVVYSALQSKNIDYKNLPKKDKNKYNNKIIHCIDLDIYFNSMKEIDLYFGKTVHPNIRRCLNGVTKKAYGYRWEEIDKNE